MRATGREVIDVIERTVDLDWFRYTRAPQDDVAAPAPITAWRFRSTSGTDEPSERVVEALSAVLDRFSGNTHWTLRFSGRNWVLLPTQVQELEDSGRFRTDGDILNYLQQQNPGFGLKAHEDLVVIADRLTRQINRGK